MILTQSLPECTDPQKETKAGDDVHNYSCALRADCFLLFNFLDAIKEGGWGTNYAAIQVYDALL